MNTTAFLNSSIPGVPLRRGKVRDIYDFGDRLLLIDEVLTPDSSRFWPVELYEPGRSQTSFDKQFVRDWLDTTSWDKNCEPPPLPDDIVKKTREKYIEAFQTLTGTAFPWL